MKISYQHIASHISSKPSISELSEKLFQLGHEHEIHAGIFNMELTPNRGDCLSLNGILRDLKIFYDLKINNDIYENDIKPFNFNFENNVDTNCSHISFLKIEVETLPKKYDELLESYFSELKLNKNNFFTDLSNYISYETGQPTHCYDLDKISNFLRLDILDKGCGFETLLDETIELQDKSMVFFDKNNHIVNLAGIVGSKASACSNNTRSVIVECAHFNPEAILGKSQKYDIKSDAAYKFERSTDPNCHEHTLRRFIKLVELHSNISCVEIYKHNKEPLKNKLFNIDYAKINKILGTDIPKSDCIDWLSRLGFEIKKETIIVPTYRNDIQNINDIAEEIARSVGYNNILAKETFVFAKDRVNNFSDEKKLKELLYNSGFYEVINDPFVSTTHKNSINVDNPLDSNRAFLRSNLKESLVKNLLYNERRQQDSIKLFEIADVYMSNPNSRKRILGIIASGRIDKNYQDFSKKINFDYIQKTIGDHIPNVELKKINITRDSIGSKSKNQISYFEAEIDTSISIDYEIGPSNIRDINTYRYNPISEYPSSIRDLSFSIMNADAFKNLEESIFAIKDDLLKEIFIFDYYNNDKVDEIKIGFRFVFQSKESTITDEEVNKVMDKIIEKALSFKSVKIPGLN